MECDIALRTYYNSSTCSEGTEQLGAAVVLGVDGCNSVSDDFSYSYFCDSNGEYGTLYYRNGDCSGDYYDGAFDGGTCTAVGGLYQGFSCVEPKDFTFTTTTTPAPVPLPGMDISNIGCDAFYIEGEDTPHAVGVCYTEGASSYVYECDDDDSSVINKVMYTSTDCSSDTLSSTMSDYCANGGVTCDQVNCGNNVQCDVARVDVYDSTDCSGAINTTRYRYIPYSVYNAFVIG